MALDRMYGLRRVEVTRKCGIVHSHLLNYDQHDVHKPPSCTTSVLTCLVVLASNGQIQVLKVYQFLQPPHCKKIQIWPFLTGKPNQELIEALSNIPISTQNFRLLSKQEPIFSHLRRRASLTLGRQSRSSSQKSRLDCLSSPL